MVEAGSGAAGGYVAFISYSHKDAAIGRWLHRKLEGYRLPRRLAGTQGEDGEVPARLTPIFRDRDELPAAGDLSAKVRAALAVSRNLIVVCSPLSAASPWVAREIATFRELHPDRPIFTAIVEGEPDQCFPPPLRDGDIEPLAADMRKGGDGRRLGLLKLVAGLAGVGLDALVQRDATRRVHRVTYVTAAAVATMLMMSLLTAFALNARTEAERQRSGAEGLVEFMLTDLRGKLKGVGRVDALAIANQRALDFYQRQDLATLPADSSLRRARILHHMAEDYITQGDLVAALLAAREAHRTTASLLKDAPKDADRILNHGQSEYWIGRVHELRREWPQATRQYNLYAQSAERLIRIDPGRPAYMIEMAWGASNRGVVQRDGYESQVAAQRSFETAISWFERASRASAVEVDSRDLANAYADLADTFHARGLWQQALESRIRSHRIIEPLVKADPEDSDLAFRLSIAERAIAHESARAGEVARGRPFIRSAYERSRALTKRDPLNVDWLLLRARIECDLLNPSLLLASGQEAGIRRSLLSSAGALEKQRNPHSSEISSCLTTRRHTRK